MIFLTLSISLRINHLISGLILFEIFLFAIKIYFISNPEPESTDLPAEHNWKIQDLIPSS